MPGRMYKRFYRETSQILTIVVLIVVCFNNNSSAFSFGSPIKSNGIGGSVNRLAEKRGILQTDLNLRINSPEDTEGDKGASARPSLNLSRLRNLKDLNKRLFKTSRHVAASDDIFSSYAYSHPNLEIESQILQDTNCFADSCQEDGPGGTRRMRKRDGVKYIFKSVATLVKAFRGVSKDSPECLEQVVTLVPTTWLKAHEQVVSEDRVESLKEATVKKWNGYKLPLLVDRKSGAILDGHHRYAVGCKLGLTRLPAVLVDYLEDESIGVECWPGCGIDSITKEDVIEMSLSNEVFPPKTSRHDFVSDLAPIDVPLSKLE